MKIEGEARSLPVGVYVVRAEAGEHQGSVRFARLR